MPAEQKSVLVSARSEESPRRAGIRRWRGLMGEEKRVDHHSCQGGRQQQGMCHHKKIHKREGGGSRPPLFARRRAASTLTKKELPRKLPTIHGPYGEQ